MRTSKFREEQIIAILKEAAAGMKTDDVCLRHGISRQTFYRWRSKYGGLEVRPRRRVRRVARSTTAPVSRPNERWAMDFVSDSLRGGRKIRALCVIDVCTRENLAIEVDLSLPSARVVRVLERLIRERGAPAAITVDNGPEFTSRTMGECAERLGFVLDFIEPGKPSQNGHVESFNGRLRDECLNQHWFLGLQDARSTISSWRRDYNLNRPHSSLGGLTPLEFHAKNFGQDPRGDGVALAA